MLTNPTTLLMTMAIALFLIGLITIGIGVVILANQAFSKNIQVIANQTTKLAQKAISEDISGLVGNASALLEALNQLARSTAGIGIFLIITSLVLFAATYGLVVNLK
jgi:hypothetical protein